ncbi:MAG: hypothetical protein IKZ82_06370 [Clostridia bacterium]|nr:hypothetical protein [Clostridia bacterium]
MTIREAITITDKLVPNQYTEAEKIMWLSMLDGLVHREVILTHVGAAPGTEAFKGYTEFTDIDTELLVPYPYDEIYRWFLEMKIDETNGEAVKYNAAAAKYNTLLETYADRYNVTHMPISKGSRFFF